MHAARLVLASLLTAHAGCGAPAPAPITFSGTRLHAVWWVAGSARQLSSFDDIRLQTSCSFDNFARTHRCLPELATAVPALYADASCTEQVYNANMASQFALAVAPVNGCTDEPEIHSFAGYASAVWTNAGGACVPAQPPGINLYAKLGPLVPLTTFVGATEQPDATGQLWLIADDGARVPWGGWDGSRAVAAMGNLDAAPRWAPWRVAYSIPNLFADAACLRPAAIADAAGSHCPIDAAVAYTNTTPNACSMPVAGLSLLALGAPVAATYAITNGACVSTPVPTAQLAFAVGAPINTASLEPADLAFVGDGPFKLQLATLHGNPIRHAQFNVPGGPPAEPPPDPFFDATLGVTCATALASDGEPRCLPTVHVAIGDLVYGDPSCQVPYAPIGGCVPAAVSVEQGGGSYGVRKLFGPTTLTTFYTVDSSGLCRTATGPAPTNLRPLGSELPASSFALITLASD
jgi:hypothetical protein